MTAKNNQRRLVDLGNGVRLVIIDHGLLDYGSRFTAEVYAADGSCSGSLKNENHFDDHGEHFAAEYDQCILKALSAKAGK